MHPPLSYNRILAEALANFRLSVESANHPLRAAEEALDGAAAFLSQEDFWAAVDALGGYKALVSRLEADLIEVTLIPTAPGYTLGLHHEGDEDDQ